MPFLLYLYSAHKMIYFFFYPQLAMYIINSRWHTTQIINLYFSHVGFLYRAASFISAM